MFIDQQKQAEFLSLSLSLSDIILNRKFLLKNRFCMAVF